jgi:hypothetical protein
MGIWLKPIGMMAVNAQEINRQKTGRRPADERESPRDKTVCFLVSEDEKTAVDSLGVSTKLTRSAILAKIVTLFLESADINRPQKDQKESEKKLLKFIEDARAAQEATPTWMKEQTRITTSP